MPNECSSAPVRPRGLKPAARHERTITRRLRFFQIIVGFAFTVSVSIAQASPPAPKQDDQIAGTLLNIVGEGFRVRETDHFAIAYDTSYEVLRPLIGRLEGTYDAIWRFCKGCDLNVVAPRSLLPVILYQDQRDYREYRKNLGLVPEATAGFYSPDTNLAVFANTLTRDEVRQITREIETRGARLNRIRNTKGRSGQNAQTLRSLQNQAQALQLQRDAIVERINRFVIQHEAAHQTLFNIGVHVRGADTPVWLAEGLACQFEVPQAQSAKGFRRVNHVRLADLRDAFGLTLHARRVEQQAYRDAFDEHRLVTLVALISDPRVFSHRDDVVAYRYAQAWALVFYLSRHRRDDFSQYLRVLSQRPKGIVIGPAREIEVFESVFGPPDDAFQRAWLNALIKLRFDPQKAGR